MATARKYELRSLRQRINSIRLLNIVWKEQLADISFIPSLIEIQNVLLPGATGDTGGSIVDGFLDSGHFDLDFFSLSISCSQLNGM
jgi:hypothetical protein